MDNDDKSLRREDRRKSYNGGTIMFGGKSTFDCIIKSRSKGGFGLSMGSTLGVPNQFKLFEKNTGETHVCHVVWRKKTMLGVEVVRNES